MSLDVVRTASNTISVARRPEVSLEALTERECPECGGQIPGPQDTCPCSKSEED